MAARESPSNAGQDGEASGGASTDGWQLRLANLGVDSVAAEVWNVIDQRRGQRGRPGAEIAVTANATGSSGSTTQPAGVSTVVRARAQRA